MTSLGYLQYSEINDNSAINGNMTELEKKKQARHNITIKKRHDTNGSLNTVGNNSSDNVQNMLKLINNSNGYDNDNDDSSNLVDFNPPPRAEISSKSPNGIGPNGMGSNGMGPNGMGANGMGPNGTCHSSDIMPNAMPSEKNFNIEYEKPTTILQNQQNTNLLENIPPVKPRQYPVPLDSYEGFNTLPKTYASDYYKQYVPYFNQAASGGDGSQMNSANKNQLLEKLNYMIHLLEEQKDEKTGHVMEEVILYSFLGVFIIFIVDSFARVGKYTR
jgi:hypothetical protein